MVSSTTSGLLIPILGAQCTWTSSSALSHFVDFDHLEQWGMEYSDIHVMEFWSSYNSCDMLMSHDCFSIPFFPHFLRSKAVSYLTKKSICLQHSSLFFLKSDRTVFFHELEFYRSCIVAGLNSHFQCRSFWPQVGCCTRYICKWPHQPAFLPGKCLAFGHCTLLITTFSPLFLPYCSWVWSFRWAATSNLLIRPIQKIKIKRRAHHKNKTFWCQAQQDISSLKNIAGETGKKLSSLASTLLNDLQDRIL